MSRISTPVLAGLLSAGALGLARRVLETRQVRRGDAAPVRALTRVLPRSRPGPVGRRLARWLPGPARTRAGRAATAAWTAPFTVVGALLAGAGGSRPVWDPDAGCWVARRVGGPSGALLAAVGFDGNALGQVVLCRGEAPSRALLAHEAVHVRQFERLGVGMALLTLWYGARYGYRDNPLERGARAGAVELLDRRAR